MKRTALLRRTRLTSKTQLKRRPKRRPPDPLRDAWKTPRWGGCQNCGRVQEPWRGDPPLHGHHVIARQELARRRVPEYDPLNRMDLCEKCHYEHEFGQANRKIPAYRLPQAAIGFAVGLLGIDGATDYFDRHYARTREVA